MGTRGLTCVVLDGAYRVAQYGQWDHHPIGHGQVALEFLLSGIDIDRLKAQIRKTRQIDTAEVKARWREITGVDTDFVTLDEDAAFMQRWPHLHRTHGAKILQYVYEAETPEVFCDLEFAADSLMCEYAYVVDLDTMQFKVYEGFNTQPLPPTERFSFLTNVARRLQLERRSTSDNTYYPVRKIWEKPIRALVHDDMKQLTVQQLTAQLEAGEQ